MCTCPNASRPLLFYAVRSSRFLDAHSTLADVKFSWAKRRRCRTQFIYIHYKDCVIFGLFKYHTSIHTVSVYTDKRKRNFSFHRLDTIRLATTRFVAVSRQFVVRRLFRLKIYRIVWDNNQLSYRLCRYKRAIVHNMKTYTSKRTETHTHSEQNHFETAKSK